MLFSMPGFDRNLIETLQELELEELEQLQEYLYYLIDRKTYNDFDDESMDEII